MPSLSVCANGTQVIDNSSYLSKDAAFYLLASITISFLAGSSAPTPLYALYQAKWGFSPITVTIIFGIYALSVLTALLFVGRLSDHLGRRPVNDAAGRDQGQRREAETGGDGNLALDRDVPARGRPDGEHPGGDPVPAAPLPGAHRCPGSPVPDRGRFR